MTLILDDGTAFELVKVTFPQLLIAKDTDGKLPEQFGTGNYPEDEQYYLYDCLRIGGKYYFPAITIKSNLN